MKWAIAFPSWGCHGFVLLQESLTFQLRASSDRSFPGAVQKALQLQVEGKIDLLQPLQDFHLEA